VKGISSLFGLLILALVLSCSYNSIMQWLQLMPNMAPAHMGVAVRNVTNGPDSAKRDDMAMPEIKADNTAKQMKYSSQVVDSGNARGDFPMMGQ
jgi:hypothetical protein